MNPETRERLVRVGVALRYWLKERDRIINQAVTEGGTYRDIGEAVGLSHTAVAFITRGRTASTNEPA
jgi:hypothetical protein